MNNYNETTEHKKSSAKDPLDLTLDEFTEFLEEIKEQPSWRSKADKEADYIDGNQLETELMQKQKALGIPPAAENIMKENIESVMGFEAKTRKDWRLSSSDGSEGQEVADALNFKLNKAERNSRADKACADAFATQYPLGIGWVEVSRESDPFKPSKYRCAAVHRNEIWWDMAGAREAPDMTQARWLIRRRWMKAKRVALKFPQHKDLIEHCDGRWTGEWDMNLDGGVATGLADSWDSQRGWSIEEAEWFDTTRKNVCLFEVWYRRWESVTVLRSKDGRVVEYDKTNPAHDMALAMGIAEAQIATVTRVRRAYYLGPHKLHDGPSPYKHQYFGYAPFFGWIEDRTGIPYGAARNQIFAQDSLNSAISKLRWGMSATRTERTKGAVAMQDEVFRQQVGRVDADIVLNAEHMATPGARFEVKRDYQLSDQHFKLMEDSRASISRTSSGASAAFSGKEGSAQSGIQEATQIEQANQGLARMMDNFGQGRTMVGEMLLSLIIEDTGEEQEDVTIEGDNIQEERTITLNKPEVDDDTGIEYRTNDVMRTRLKVSLDDVPTTSSFRAQQLSTMGEAVKSMTPAMQSAVMPFMVDLMDLPYRKEMIEAIRQAMEAESPEAIEARIKEAVQQALKDSAHDLKARELDMKAERQAAELKKLIAETVQTGVQSAFSAMQAAQVIATMPQVAPVADVVMQGAGYQAPNPMGQDPNFPQPDLAGVPVPDIRQNTSPEFPPIPQQGPSAMQGIETMTPNDNTQGVTP